MSNNKEASARIKINQLLQKSGWRFFATDKGKANIELEGKVTYTKAIEENLGENFEGRTTGYLDYTLLDSRGFPICVVEAKRSNIHPLSAKDQAFKYAKENHARFIILTNGDSHYQWDTQRGHPEDIDAKPEGVFF